MNRNSTLQENGCIADLWSIAPLIAAAVPGIYFSFFHDLFQNNFGCSAGSFKHTANSGDIFALSFPVNSPESK